MSAGWQGGSEGGFLTWLVFRAVVGIYFGRS